MKWKNKKTGEIIECSPTLLNASKVSAQNRKRLFWVGRLDEFGTYQKVEIPQPEDRGILLKDILEENVDEKYFLNEKNIKHLQREFGSKGKIVNEDDKSPTITASAGMGGGNQTCVRIGQINSGGQGDRIYSIDGKSTSLSALGGGGGAKTGLYCVGIIPESIKPKGNYLPRERVFSDIGKSRAISTSQSQMPFYEQNYKIRKLTPVECERLQGLQEEKKSSIIQICKENLKNSVIVENQNLKSQNVVGNVENDNLKQTVKFVEKNLNINNQQKKELVQPNVLINCEENKVEIHNQGKLLLSVNGVEWKQKNPLLKMEDFVALCVGINTIVEKIINFGGEGLHQQSNLSVVKENGNNVVNMYGEEIMQLVKDVKIDSITLNKLLKFITLDHFTQENKEPIIQTLFLFVANVILGFIPKETLNQNILTFQINTKVGYTFGISNTQRYKTLGNAFNVDVVAHIIKELK